MKRVRWLAMVTVIAGCGGPSAGTTTTTTTTTGRETTLEGPSRPWAELTGDEKRAHMFRAVMPSMATLFAEYDSARFENFDCATCHGQDASARNFAMPNPSILALHPTGSEGQHETVRRFPEGVVFMFSRVMPAMRTLVGASEFDPSTGTGFTCYACHPSAGTGTTP